MSEDEYVRDEHQRGRPPTRLGKKQVYTYIPREIYENVRVQKETRGLSITRILEEIITGHYTLSIIDLLNLQPEIRNALEEKAKSQKCGVYQLVQDAVTEYVKKTEKKAGKGRKSKYEEFREMVVDYVTMWEREHNRKRLMTEDELMRFLHHLGVLDQRTLKNYLSKMTAEGLAKPNLVLGLKTSQAMWQFMTNLNTIQPNQNPQEDRKNKMTEDNPSAVAEMQAIFNAQSVAMDEKCPYSDEEKKCQFTGENCEEKSPRNCQNYRIQKARERAAQNP